MGTGEGEDLDEYSEIFTRKVVPACGRLAHVWVASDVEGQSRTYTLDADFDEGSLVNVNHDSPNGDHLRRGRPAPARQ